MTFKLYREAVEAADGALVTGPALTAAFRAYMGVRYYNMGSYLAADQKNDAGYSAALSKASWEFDAFKDDTTKARSAYNTRLGFLEEECVKAYGLKTLLLDGTQTYKLSKAAPIIADKAWEHIFHGEASGAIGVNQTHVGLHSRVKIAANQHNSGKRANQIDIDVGGRDADTGVYKAAVTIYGKPKNSTFFPDHWTEPKVKEYVTAAAKYWCIPGSGANQTKNEANGLVTWAGKCMVALANGGLVELWIGGLGDPKAAGGIKTAFPQFEGSFDP